MHNIKHCMQSHVTAIILSKYRTQQYLYIKIPLFKWWFHYPDSQGDFISHCFQVKVIQLWLRYHYTWSADEYEIKLGCVWNYTSAHMHVSAVAYTWDNQNNRHTKQAIDQHADNPELIYLSSTHTWACTSIQTHSHINDNAATAVHLDM